MQKAKWGVLSTAAIATEKVVPGMQKGASCDILAIASRDLEKAQAAAVRLGLPRAYGSYEELLADPDIDAIYNSLPNHLHVPWSIKALEAGKHILCEKPIARSSDEAAALLEAAQAHPDLHVMEAFMYRFHPQWEQVHQMVRQGEIGELRTIHAFFSYFNVDPADIRNQAQIGGGGMLDIGCYPVSVSRWLYGSEPNRVLATIELDPQFGTDRLTSAVLEFEDGTALFTSATQLAPFQQVSVHGREGWILVEIPFNAPQDERCRLLHMTEEGGRREILLDPADQYTIQADLFSEAVLGHRPVPTPLEDALANMKVIDAVFDSARDGAWVDL